MKAEPVIETLLEMHFHSALIELMRQQYAPGTVRLFKPSPGKEAFLGFDQGWVHADPATVDLLAEIEAFAAGTGPAPRIYSAYFLQFKTVDKMVKTSALAPSGFHAPYFRSELRMEASKNALFSQHDLLLKVSTIPNADVFYACGMMFSADEVWQTPDLGKLRVVDVRNAPTLASGRHFLCFQTQNGPAFWCSEPIPAHAVPPAEWAAARVRHLLTPRELLAVLEDVVSTTRNLRQPSGELDGRPVPERVARLRRLWPPARVSRTFNVLRFGDVVPEARG